MNFSSPASANISPFSIPETPRTEASSQMNLSAGTPKKFKSPKTQLMEDVTMSMSQTTLSTPPKDQRANAGPVNNQRMMK